MNAIFETLEKKTQSYIDDVTVEVEPENVAQITKAMKTDVYTGALMVVDSLEAKITADNMNVWEVRQELAAIKNNLASFLNI